MSHRNGGHDKGGGEVVSHSGGGRIEGGRA